MAQCLVTRFIQLPQIINAFQFPLLPVELFFNKGPVFRAQLLVLKKTVSKSGIPLLKAHVLFIVCIYLNIELISKKVTLLLYPPTHKQVISLPLELPNDFCNLYIRQKTHYYRYVALFRPTIDGSVQSL